MSHFIDNLNFPVLDLRDFKITIDKNIGILDHTFEGRNEIIEPHKHDFYLFFLVQRSAGTHSIDFVDYPVHDLQLHILLPGQVHAWQLAPGTEGWQLMFSEEVFQLFNVYSQLNPTLFFHHPVLELTADNFPFFKQEFIALNRELQAQNMQSSMVLMRCALLCKMIGYELEQVFSDTKILAAAPIIGEYLKLVDLHFKAEKSVSFYAEKLNITANYLNQLCRKKMHTSAHIIIHNRVALEAKRLLRISTMTIKEIAFNLGFNELSYFSSFFKKHTGTAPRAFREMP